MKKFIIICVLVVLIFDPTDSVVISCTDDDDCEGSGFAACCAGACADAADCYAETACEVATDSCSDSTDGSVCCRGICRAASDVPLYDTGSADCDGHCDNTTEFCCGGVCAPIDEVEMNLTVCIRGCDSLTYNCSSGYTCFQDFCVTDDVFETLEEFSCQDWKEANGDTPTDAPTSAPSTSHLDLDEKHLQINIFVPITVGGILLLGFALNFVLIVTA